MLKEKPFSLAEAFGPSFPQALTVNGYEKIVVTDEMSAGEVARAEYLSAHIPAAQPGYVFRPDLLRDFNAWYKTAGSRPLLMYGPSGSGKTSLARQFAARIGVPVFQITGSSDMELIEIFGHYLPSQDGVVFKEGPATEAARVGGILIVDEIDRMRETVTVGLNGLFEGGPFTLAGKGGEVIVPHKNFRIVGTANSNLSGDESGLYNTARIHDKALVDRFFMSMEVGFMTPAEEKSLVLGIFAKMNDKAMSFWFDEEGIKLADETSGTTLVGSHVTRDKFAEGMLKVANMVRKQTRDGGNTADSALERGISTRKLLDWSEQCLAFCHAPKLGKSGLHYALKTSLTNTCNPSTKVAIHEIVKSVFGVEETV